MLLLYITQQCVYDTCQIHAPVNTCLYRNSITYRIDCVQAI